MTGEIVRKVKHSSVRIKNPLLALHRDGVFQPREDFSDSLGALIGVGLDSGKRHREDTGPAKVACVSTKSTCDAFS